MSSNSNPNKVYAIEIASGGRIRCSCMAYRFMKGEVGRKAPCKHLSAVYEDGLLAPAVAS